MYLAIEGVIGVGKTTLARLLKPSFEAALLLEVFEENPFLSDFYSDRERYAFQTQIFFERQIEIVTRLDINWNPVRYPVVDRCCHPFS